LTSVTEPNLCLKSLITLMFGSPRMVVIHLDESLHQRMLLGHTWLRLSTDKFAEIEPS